MDTLNSLLTERIKYRAYEGKDDTGERSYGEEEEYKAKKEKISFINIGSHTVESNYKAVIYIEKACPVKEGDIIDGKIVKEVDILRDITGDIFMKEVLL